MHRVAQSPAGRRREDALILRNQMVRIRGFLFLCAVVSPPLTTACSATVAETGAVAPEEPAPPEGLPPPPRCCYPVRPPFPRRTEPIPSTQIWLGQPATIDLSQHFTFDGRQMHFTVTSSSPDTVQVSVAGDTLTLDGLELGHAWVTVKGHIYHEAWQQFYALVVPPTAPPNRGPVRLRTRHATISDSGYIVPSLAAKGFRVRVGAATTIDLSTFFSDPDGDPLSYEAVSEKPAVLSASISASTLILEGHRSGQSRVTVWAIDPGGLFAWGREGVLVTNQ